PDRGFPIVWVLQRDTAHPLTIQNPTRGGLPHRPECGTTADVSTGPADVVGLVTADGVPVAVIHVDVPGAVDHHITWLAGSHAHAAHPGPVVVTGPRGTRRAPQGAGRARFVEQPRDVHGAPGRTIHPVPVRDRVGVVAVGLGVFTDAGSRQTYHVTGLAPTKIGRASCRGRAA